MTEPTELSQLRHLYQNMVNGAVRDTASAKRIAEGLLAPAIAALERTTPQPTHAQAGAVPLTPFIPAQRERLYYNRPENVGKDASLADWHRIVQYIEAAHGIKGDQQ